MSFDVMLLVTFPCSQLDGVAALARRYLPLTRSEAERRDCQEAIAFLEEVAARRGPADRGPKNGIVAWSYGGNYTNPGLFVNVLRAFWDELLRSPVDGGPLRISHIVVVYQLQDAENASAIELFLDGPAFDDWESEEAWMRAPLVEIAHENLPFRWL